jgi:hypothetical protein
MFMSKVVSALALGALATMTSGVSGADEWPLAAGDYWEVTGIDIKDGGALKYAQFIAGEWKENLEFSKSKGWIKGYKIFGNVYARAGEPDLYLVTIRESLPSAAEGEKRNDEFQAWKKKTIAQMETESGNRTQYREVLADELLQEYTIKP